MTYRSWGAFFALGSLLFACSSESDSSGDPSGTGATGGANTGGSGNAGTGGSGAGGSGNTGNTAGGGTGGASCALTQCGESCVDTASDSDNCGRCGRACGGGSACESGACSPVKLGDQAQDPDDFTIDGDSIVYLSQSKIYRQPLAGGAANLVADAAGSGWSMLRAHGGKLYVMSSDGSDDKSLVEMDATGGAAKTLFTVSFPVQKLFLRGNDVYFQSYCSSVHHVSLAGGTPTALTATACNVFGQAAFTVDAAGANVYRNFKKPGGIAQLDRVSLPSGAITKLHDDFDTGELLAGKDRLYFTTLTGCSGGFTDLSCTGGSVGSMGFDGAGQTALADLSQLAPSGFRSVGSLSEDSEGALYFYVLGTDGQAWIYRVDPQSQAVDLVQHVQKSPKYVSRFMQLDDQYVYYIDDNDQLYKVAK